MVHVLFHLIFTNHKIPVKKVENSSLINLETVLEIKVFGHASIRHFSRVQLFVTLWTIAHQAPQSMGFPKQWSGLPFLPPGDLLNPKMEPESPVSPALAGGPFYHQHYLGLPGGSDGKASACNAGNLGSTPGLGRSPGEGNGNPLSIIAWKIPCTKGPRRLQSMGLQRVGHD